MSKKINTNNNKSNMCKWRISSLFDTQLGNPQVGQQN